MMIKTEGEKDLELELAKTLLHEYKVQQRELGQIREEIKDFVTKVGMDTNYAENAVSALAYLSGWIHARGKK